MSVYRRKGHETYSYDFRYRGSRFSGSTGCTTKRDAQRFESAKKEGLRSLDPHHSKPLTLKAATARYWVEVGQFHRNHVDTIRHIDWFLQELGETTPLSSITDSDIATLVAKRRGHGVSNATVNRSVCEPLRGILLRARKVWKAQTNDIAWKDHFLKEAQEIVREATPDEERRLLSAMRGDYAPALRFALLTGCRRAEIVSLEWKAVDFFNKVVTIHGKGDRKRSLPITAAIFAILKDALGKHPEKVFTYVAKMPRKDAGTTRPITMEGFKTEWRRTRKRAKVTDFRFHDTRHTAGSRVVRNTGNIKLAQKMLGHSDIKTTSRYAHVSMDDLRAGMETLTPIQNTTPDVDTEDNALENKGNMV